MVQRERDQLLKEKLPVLHNLMITDRVVSLGVLAAGLGHHIRNSLSRFGPSWTSPRRSCRKKSRS